MTYDNDREQLALSIYINARGFGYALFEGLLRPVDWGIKTVRGASTSECIRKAHVILHRFQPSVLVLQDCDGRLSRCSNGVRKWIDAITTVATGMGTQVRFYSRADIRARFSFYGAMNKDEIARELAKQLPEFAPKVPPMRKLWMSEDYRMVLFDALALMHTYYSDPTVLP